MSRAQSLTWSGVWPALSARLGPSHRKLAWYTLTVIGLVALPYIIVLNRVRSTWGFDAYAYWAIDLGDLYGRSLQNTSGYGAFRYTPAIGQAFSVFGVLPWEAFFAGWFALMLVALVWMAGRDALPLLAFPPLALELYHANVHLFMAVAIVLGFRWPATWAFLVLTKVTPGIGLLWFAIRREWRSLAIALGVTVGLATLSFVVAPALWREYVLTMVDNLFYDRGRPYPIPVPIAVRLVLAAALVMYGARTDRRWLVPVASTIALPIIWWHGLSMLIAAIPLWRADRAARAAGRAAGHAAGPAAGPAAGHAAGPAASRPALAGTGADPRRTSTGRSGEVR
ncbi:MAG TPA: glycosyltransferase family 87 protein [Candidatus Limnocylindrales bacterium]